MSLVAIFEAAIATVRGLTAQLARALRRAIAKRPGNGRGRLAA
jgi:hypothetical protein